MITRVLLIVEDARNQSRATHWLVVLAAGLAVFMATVDASVVLPASRTGRVLLSVCRRPGPPGSLEA